MNASVRDNAEVTGAWSPKLCKSLRVKCFPFCTSVEKTVSISLQFIIRSRQRKLLCNSGVEIRKNTLVNFVFIDKNT